MPGHLTPWACDACTAVVFIPDDSGITGGVCPWKSRGCSGSLSRCPDEKTKQALVARVQRNGVEIEPWLVVEFLDGLFGFDKMPPAPPPPLRDVVEIRETTGPRGGRRYVMRLECGCLIWGGRPRKRAQCLPCWWENTTP